MTPAAGPDSIRCAGLRLAVSGVSVPPADCITSSLASIPRLQQPVDERAEVARDGRADVGVDDRGARALVLPDLGQDLGGAGDVDAVSDRGPHDLLDPPLVLIVDVRVQKRDRDRLDVLLGDPLRHIAHGRLVQLAPHLAARPEALVDLEPQTARDERLRMLVLDVVEHGDAKAAHLEHIAETVRGDEGCPGADAFEDGVRRHRRGVHDTVDPTGSDVVLAEERLGARHDSARVVVRRREDLGRAD